jgi:hypothetical protein
MLHSDLLLKAEELKYIIDKTIKIIIENQSNLNKKDIINKLIDLNDIISRY